MGRRERALTLLRAAVRFVEQATDAELADDYMDCAETVVKADGETPNDGVFYDGVHLDGDGRIGHVLVEWVAGT